jgi:adhesin transport system membrane fusion protein
MEQRKKALDEAQSRLVSAQKDAALAMEQMRMMERALKEEVVSKMKYVKAEQEANEAQAKLSQAQHEVPKAKAALAEAMQHRENYIHQRIAEYEKERHEIKRKLNTMQAKGVTLKAKVGHSEVRAPVTGTVKKINYTTIGAVLRPGADIMEIIPTDDKLIVEAKVRPRDIGFIHPGLPARVKLTAYDFSTYGGLKGEVIYVSADSITDKKGRSYFIVRVKTDRNYIVDKKGKRHIVIPGMQTETDIVVDKKSILKYILKPMLK